MAVEKLNKKMVKTSVLAGLFGVSDRRVQQLATDGILSTQKVGTENQYELSTAVKEYILHLQSRIEGKANKENVSLETQKLQAETDFKKAKARMAQLSLKELEGQMHRSEDVEASFTDLVMTIRSLLLSLPGQLAVDVCEAATPNVASGVIKKGIEQVLTELSEYKYDPEKYRERVRNRQGWLSDESQDEQSE